MAVDLPLVGARVRVCPESWVYEGPLAPPFVGVVTERDAASGICYVEVQPSGDGMWVIADEIEEVLPDA